MRALIAAMASLLLAACGTEPSPTTSATSPPSEGSAELSYVALGDSLATTYGGEASVAYPTLYGEAAEEALGQEVVVENRAIPGITSGDLLGSLQESWLRDMIAEAEIVTIHIGGNDFRGAESASQAGDCAAESDLSCHRRALEDFKENFEAIVQEILSLRSPTDTVIRVLDNFDFRPGNRVFRLRGFPPDYAETIRPIIEEWNEFTCDLAESNDIPCASLYEAFNGPRGTDSPFQAGLLESDGEHLTDKGHEAIATELVALGFKPLA